MCNDIFRNFGRMKKGEETPYYTKNPQWFILLFYDLDLFRNDNYNL